MSRAVFHGSSGFPPVPTKEISGRALDYEYNDQIPLAVWLRTATTLLREADVYYKEGNEEQAFLLYMRHMNLIVTHLPSHPQARDPRYEKLLVDMNTKFPAIAGRMEKLKTAINSRYEAYQRERQRQKELDEQLRQQRRSRGSSISSSNGSNYGFGPEGRVPHYPDQGRGRPGELEKMGRRLSMQTTHSSNTSPSLHPAFTPKEHFEEHGWNYEPAIPTPTEPGKRISWKKPADEEFDLQKRLQELHLRTHTPIPLALQPGQQLKKKEELEKVREKEKERDKERLKNPRPLSLPYPLAAETKARTEYPLVPKRTPYPTPSAQMPNLDDFANPSKLEQYRQSIERMPIVPPKIKDEYDPSYAPPQIVAPPARPVKERTTSISSAPAGPSQSVGSMGPPDKPSSKKSYSTHIFECVAYTEGGEPLRTIFIPKGLRQEFLKIAAPNTKRNLETCGILAGFLRNNAFFVSRLVIPEQSATSDRCDMTNESSLFDYIDAEDLMVLGWIHTHPTQTCFMSSVDLHTHSGYQMMLQESIAIVCAPQSEPSWGVFRLTDPDGVKTIKNCKAREMFHPHSTPHVYTDALRPGHVCEVDRLGFRVYDLRPGS
ncbi:hypothetical protein TWF696_006208 [Orbilia brochopaga]|uniref:MPN domain-containing protein n=1 Tax=Orbilia brochopaga TaxID=3140254 RepID=A0AAV9UWY7_9PEZI